MRARLQRRADVINALRGFFAERDVLEVQTPILSQAGNTDPNIESFSTTYSGPWSGGAGTRWLRTSPEFFHKRLLADGSGDVYEIASVFRNGESGPRHNPEFTLLEWYRLGFDHHALMDEVEELVRRVAARFGRRIDSCERLSYQACYQRFVALDPLTASLQQLDQALAPHSIDVHGLSRDDRLDLLRTHAIEPQLAPDALLFIYDFPASQAALARLSSEDERVCARFELYLGSREVANGYHELTDVHEQRRRFAADLASRASRGVALPAVDERLLAALPRLPDCAGVALGVERLLQWLFAHEHIDALLPFPFAQA